MQTAARYTLSPTRCRTNMRDDCAAARSFLTHGTWTNASSSQLLPQHPACRINVHSRVWRYSSSWEGNTLKYKGAPACINHPHMQWLPGAAPRRVPRLIDAVPLGITLWFIGDSTSIEHAQSAACRIASEDEQTVWTDWYTPELWPVKKGTPSRSKSAAIRSEGRA